MAAVSGLVTVRGNNQYYAIERSENDIDFTVLGKIDGHRTSNLAHFYQFIDAQPVCSASYYRLRQIDISHEEQFTKILSNNIVCNEITMLPNPFTTQFTITFATTQKHATIKIIDVLGKEIKFISFIGEQLTIEKGELIEGVYWVQVIDDTKNVVNKKVVIE
jgi:hypothetical protein